MQCCIGGVFEPALDENTVIGLQREVLSHVVYDNCFVQGTPDSAEIFDKYHVIWRGVLSVESVGDALLTVDRVEHPIGVVLHRCGENHYFVHCSHL